MPVYRKIEYLHSTVPWNEWKEWIMDQPHPKRFFKTSQYGTLGFVIAWWQSDRNLPTHYLSSEHNQKSFSWAKFDDPTRAENPRQYTDLKEALEVIEALRIFNHTDRIGLVFWTHPERHYKAIDNYILMSGGSQFPGTVSQ